MATKSKGNKNLFSALTGKGQDKKPEVSAVSETARPSAAKSVIGHRQTSLQQIAGGEKELHSVYWVDPNECRMWDEHDRDYALLNEESCADLIEGMLEQGKQTTPATVRLLENDPNHKYEVICGARRHWTIAFLREQKKRTEFKFCIQVKKLTDEEAFRESDVENRARKDISDYERAMKYMRGLKKHYGKQKDMAERLEMSEDKLSKFLTLAKLPREIVQAYASPNEIPVAHGAKLVPLLKEPANLGKLKEAALTLKKRQGQGTAIDAASVLRQLLVALSDKPQSAGPLAIYKARAGHPILVVTKKDTKALHLNVPLAEAGTLEEVVDAFRAELSKHLVDSLVEA